MVARTYTMIYLYHYSFLLAADMYIIKHHLLYSLTMSFELKNTIFFLYFSTPTNIQIVLSFYLLKLKKRIIY